MERMFTILGFAGSLRKGSHNKALLRAASELVPKGANLEIFDLEGIALSTRIWKTSLRKGLKNSK